MPRWHILRRSRKERPILWLLPLAILLAGFYLYPIVDIVRLSFTNAGLLTHQWRYTPSSYIRIFGDSDFYYMIGITLVFVTASVAFQLVFGFLIALGIDACVKRKLVGTILARTVVLTGWAIPGVVIGIIWRLLLDESSIGVINYLLSRLGLWSVPLLSTPAGALLSTIIANVWRGTAFSMTLQYAGLKTIPDDVYEAATVDGASPLQQVSRITLPLVKPIIYVNIVLITISTFNTFDMVAALTGGGPGRATEVIALNVYNTIFKSFNLGQGAAVAVVLLIINAMMTALYYRMIKRDEEVAL